MQVKKKPVCRLTIKVCPKQGTGANSDPGKSAHGVISNLSIILRFTAFPQVPTHLQPQDSWVFTGGRGLFLTIGILHFKDIVFK
jgi:hypothetical protein